MSSHGSPPLRRKFLYSSVSPKSPQKTTRWAIHWIPLKNKIVSRDVSAKKGNEIAPTRMAGMPIGRDSKKATTQYRARTSKAVVRRGMSNSQFDVEN